MGGSEKYLIRAIQVMQNKAARIVTKLSWFTPTHLLLKQCNWLSVSQLIFFQTAVQIWKIRKYETPTSLFKRLKPSNTRSGGDGTLSIPLAESGLARKSFMVRSAVSWNQIPAEIRNIDNIHGFRIKLKQWFLINIDID